MVTQTQSTVMQHVTYLSLLGIGLEVIWQSFTIAGDEQVYRLIAVSGGAIFLVWGLTLTPLPWQIFMEGVSLLAVFPVCIPCLKE
jgi:hypothetical protein